MLGPLSSNISPVEGYHPGLSNPGCDVEYAHDAITLEALDMLKDDYNYAYREFYYTLGFEMLCSGSTAADLYDQENDNHFHSPTTHAYGGSSYVLTHFNNAVSSHNQGDYATAFFELGKALHLVQDLTGPHHAHGDSVTDLSNGHAAYEIVADAYSVYVYGINSNYNGIYSPSTLSPSHSGWSTPDPRAFLDYGAHASIGYYSYVDGVDGSGNNYDYALRPLLALAVQLSSGFLKLFVDNIKPRFLDVSIYGSKLITDNDWKDIILGVNKDGSVGEFYIHASCNRWTNIWDDESSYGPTHGNGYYQVGTGTFTKYSTDSSGKQLYQTLRIRWTSEECHAGGSQLRITLREYDGTNYETIIGYNYFTIPSSPGTYGVSSPYSMSGSGNTFQFYMVVS
jgi:hypothetical protein